MFVLEATSDAEPDEGASPASRTGVGDGTPPQASACCHRLNVWRLLAGQLVLAAAFGLVIARVVGRRLVA